MENPYCEEVMKDAENDSEDREGEEINPGAVTIAIDIAIANF